MRRGNKPDWIEDHNNLVGLSLDADYVAEHEWGIKRLKEMLEIDSSILGIEGRRIKHFDPNDWIFFISSDKNKAILYFDPSYHTLKDVENPSYGAFSSWAKHMLPLSSDLVAAWDESSFGVHVSGKDNVKNLTRIVEAAKNLDLALWLGGGGAFKNAGLNLAIVSLIPKESKLKMLKADEERNDFKKLVEKVEKETQIKEKLEKAGLKWYALSPRPSSPHDKTKYPIIYWLNPQSYKQYHQWNMLFSWVTIETLLDFVNGNEAAIVINPHARGH